MTVVQVLLTIITMYLGKYALIRHVCLKLLEPPPTMVVCRSCQNIQVTTEEDGITTWAMIDAPGTLQNALLLNSFVLHMYNQARTCYVHHSACTSGDKMFSNVKKSCVTDAFWHLQQR